jgi:uncharacterized membrane protein HdeD (DUF308 family)
VSARVILAALAVVFLVAAVLRAVRVGAAHPEPRTWLLIAVLFGAVSTWLFMAQ